jgi:ATP-dependent exoDNAse (exonuclease V) beta subunit
MLAPFTVYNASAGAGKTYSLVRQYLKLCLAHDDASSFMHILAITFTKKAAQEMKQRLLKQLLVLSTYPKLSAKEEEYCIELAKELEIAPERLAFRAHNSLRRILHNYSAFSVSTIDSFTNRLIRSFSRDLNLSSNYQVELEDKLILQEAIDRMLSDLERDSDHTKVLLRFVEGQLNEGKSTNYKSVLLDTAQQLFKEKAQAHLLQLEKLNTSDFLQTEKQLKKRLSQIEKGQKELAQEAIAWGEERGLNEKCFSRGTLWKRTLALTENLGLYTVASLKPLFEPGKDLFAKNAAPEIKELMGIYQEDFRAKLLGIHQFLANNYEEYLYIQAVVKSLYGLAVLAEIAAQLEIVKLESNRIPIGEFNKIISENLRSQPAPFLYEKLGDRFQHFFIDEFQDTSTLQWLNLVPLINNSLAEGASSAMVVGDAKQSIYRFRNGEVQLFIDLYNNTEPSNRLGQNELYPRETINLGSNFRSLKNIVGFNNGLFQGLSSLFNDDKFRKIYADSAQEPQADTGGYVEVRFLAKEDYELSQFQNINLTIKDALSRGFKQSDICILVGANAKGRSIARYLLQNESDLDLPKREYLKLLSVDSLNIGASVEVKGLISFLSMLEKPKDYSTRKDWLLLSYEIFGTHIDRHDYFKLHGRQETALETAFLEEQIPGFNFQNWDGLDLLQKIYLLINQFSLALENDPYLQLLIDQVDNFIRRESPLSENFINWWYEKGNAESVQMPEELDAVQIMSIHKSKGLEFPIVIAAFSAGQLVRANHQEQLWLELPKYESFKALPTSLLSLKKPKPEQEAYLDQYINDFNNEEKLMLLDTVNRYYVAYTRAEKELYIFSSKDHTGDDKSKHWQCLLYNHLGLEGEADFYSSGEKLLLLGNNAENNKLKSPEHFTVSRWQEVIAVLSSAPKNWEKSDKAAQVKGSQVHQLLSQIIKKEDLEPALSNAYNKGWFNREELAGIRELLTQVLNHPELQELFSAEVEVLNERSILIPGANRKIPDRVVLMGNQAYIIDYKTGEAKEEHHFQVEEYAELLEEAGFLVSKKMLLYLNDELILKKV